MPVIETIANSTNTPFLYGAGAHLPPRSQGKSDFVIIEISQHPILYSRAIGTLQPEEKLTVNRNYLTECQRICESSCPIRENSEFRISCKRMSLIKAIAKTEDRLLLTVGDWSEILRLGLCKPTLYECASWK